jgi:bacterioferritin-associated ferredoxin
VYICICHGITDHQIRSCVKDGRARSLCDLQGQLGVATQCGCCQTSAQHILDEALGRSVCEAPAPAFAVAA